MDEEQIKTIAQIVRETLKPQNEFSLANKPFKTEEDKTKEEAEKLILKPNEAKNVDKKLESFKTHTFLDGLFLDHEEKPIGGIPYSGQFGIVGMPDAGKSILMEEIAVRVASSGKKVLFVTSEDIWRSDTPRFDLESRMKQKSDLIVEKEVEEKAKEKMPEDELEIVKRGRWKIIQENLYVMDTVTNSELNDWWTFAQAYKYACKAFGIELSIIDSVTVLQDYRGALKYRLMELIRYGQLHGITGLFVNQRSKEAWDSYDIAGGVGLAHNLDGTIIIDFGGYWDHAQMKQDFADVGIEVKRKMLIRIVRVLGCRMSNFNRHYIPVTISSEGFLRMVEE